MEKQKVTCTYPSFSKPNHIGGSEKKPNTSAPTRDGLEGALPAAPHCHLPFLLLFCSDPWELFTVASQPHGDFASSLENNDPETKIKDSGFSSRSISQRWKFYFFAKVILFLLTLTTPQHAIHLSRVLRSLPVILMVCNMLGFPQAALPWQKVPCYAAEKICQCVTIWRVFSWT